MSKTQHAQLSDETLKRLEESQTHFVSQVMMRGRSIRVLPQVFSPAFFEDTAFFAEELPILPGNRVLEIGTGTGAVALAAIDRGASCVLAVDVNPEAVRNAQLNVRAHALEHKIEVRWSDVFSALSMSDGRFDVLFWNVPFADRQPTNVLERSVFDEGYRSIERYISEAKHFLVPTGRLFIGFSDTLGRLDLLEQLWVRHRYCLQKVASRSGSEGRARVSFDLYELIHIPLSLQV